MGMVDAIVNGNFRVVTETSAMVVGVVLVAGEYSLMVALYFLLFISKNKLWLF